jgi:hypothetical protein
MIEITSNAAAFLRGLENDRARKLPRVMAAALTRTAADVRADAARRIASVFDRPVTFTRRAIYTANAKPSRLSARVGIKPIQAKYLGLQEDGGTRRPARRALLIPVRARLNRYGNLSRGQVARLLARPDTFSGSINGHGGIWQRTRSGGLKLLIAYAASARYRARFGFVAGAEAEATASLPGQFARAFAEFT